MDDSCGILLGLRRNDPEIYREFIDAHGDKLLRLAYMIVGDMQLAEDVVQESFLTLYQKIDTFREESSLITWLTRITVNKAKDKVRPKLLQKITYFAEVSTEDSTLRPENVFEKNEEMDEVRSVLLELPLKYRDVLYLYYYEDMKIKEIAQILDLGVSGVKTRLQRGKERMKELLLERGLV